MPELAQRYEHNEVEPRIRRFWEENKTFSFNPKTAKRIFSVDTPPPTISGKMHLGHACSYTQQDFMVRFKRMQGFEIFYPFGTDDNGLATDRMIEKMKGVKSAEMKREEYVRLVLKALEEIRPAFVEDWKKLGVSCDFSYYYTTIDDHSRRITQKSFIDLYNMGREYRKESPTLWCPECRMAIAQVEMKDKEISSMFNDIVFKIDGKDVAIATTRPELLPACVAVFVHPEDKRYEKLVGKKAKVPLLGFEVPVLKDERVEQGKGTGIVMCCTFGDQTDIEWYLAHKLPLKMVLTREGRLNEHAGKYAGLSIRQARKQIVEDLKAANLLTKEVPIKHNVNTHERCGTEIEILNAKCWFIKYLDLKETFLELGKKMKWYPDFMQVRYQNWIKGLQWDWCISRQRHYGVPFPLWYCRKCGEVILAEEKDLPVDPTSSKPKKKCKCGSGDFEPETDVMDTWATSSLSPQLCLQLVKDEKVRKKMYPMSLRPQAHDIITFWLFNTVVKSWLHFKTIPWTDIAISGYVLDPHGQKMSKSKGNVIDPHGLMERFGADSVRFWAGSSRLGEDAAYQEKDVVTGQKTINKLWNASRFLAIHINERPGRPRQLAAFDRWILAKLSGVIRQSTEHFERYDFSLTKSAAENFFWHDFCDNYLEIIKNRLYEQKDESARFTLYTVMLNQLKLFAPIIPHVTEELYQKLFSKHEKEQSIHISKWPEPEWTDNAMEKEGDVAVGIISAVRQWKQANKLPLNTELKEVMVEKEKEKMIKPFLDDIMAVTKAKKLTFDGTFCVKQ